MFFNKFLLNKNYFFLLCGYFHCCWVTLRALLDLDIDFFLYDSNLNFRSCIVEKNRNFQIHLIIICNNYLSS